MNGVLVLDKSAGVSSAGAVEQVKRALGVRRAGHAGTLDPIATGVLPICLGEATKLAGYMLAEDKEYLADAILGVETDTLDRTGTVTASSPVDITRERVLAALAARTGEQEQIPPMFSAIKQGGVRLYHRARAGQDVERQPRRVRIDRLELVAFDPPRVQLAIACTKGTYVRSLVADLGRDLGCGAHLGELRRTRAGLFAIEQAVTLPHVVGAPLVPLSRATTLPARAVPAELVSKIRSGVQLPASVLHDPPPEGERFQLLVDGDSLLAVAHVDAGRLVYDRVFHLDASGDLPQSAP